VEWLIGSPENLKRYGEEVMTISNDHGFALWLGWGMAWCGISLTLLEQAEEGHPLVAQALSTMRNAGAVLGTPSVLMWLAEAQAKIGHPVEGLKCLVEAMQLIEVTDERFMEAELHRLRGDLFRTSTDDTAAEQSYLKAIAVAQRQSGKLFELRAATSLARLWRDQGKRQQAHDLLAPVYDWFTEGFDTLDLKEAKALLEQLKL
jgi:predicted ATPase